MNRTHERQEDGPEAQRPPRDGMPRNPPRRGHPGTPDRLERAGLEAVSGGIIEVYPK